MKCLPPNEEQRELLKRNNIDPNNLAVVYECDEYIIVMPYKTRNEITLRKFNTGERIHHGN
jgi:hypothetical protein